MLNFRQMDFEFALWQMLYLVISPNKVYRNAHFQKSKFREPSICLDLIYASFVIYAFFAMCAFFVIYAFV